MPEPSLQKPRRRFAFSLRTLMLLVLACGLFVGWQYNGAESQRRAVVALKEAGATVLYDHESGNGFRTSIAQKWVPKWLRRSLGDDYFQDVTYVNLTGQTVGMPSKFTESHLEPLQSLRGLEELLISSEKMNDAWLARLAGLKRLRVLFIAKMLGATQNLAITDAGLVHLNDMPRLRSLTITDTSIADKGLVSIGRATELMTLDLANSKIEGPGLSHLSRMTKLISLNLADTPLTDAGLVEVGRLTSLKNLSIFGTKTTEAGMAHLSSLSNLKSLRLGPENSSDAGLAHLHGLSGLERLYVSGPRVTDVGLAYLKGMPELELLNLTATKITDQGLAQLSGLKKLQTLWIGGQGSQITDAGLAHLAELRSLEELTLKDTRLTDRGLASLKGLNRLKRLSVDFTQVSGQGLKDLQAALPSLIQATNQQRVPAAANKSEPE